MERRTVKEMEFTIAVAQHYGPVVAAAGYDLRQLTASEVPYVFNHIKNHPAVVKALFSSDRFKIFSAPGAGAFSTDWLGLLASLGEEGRASLRGE